MPIALCLLAAIGATDAESLSHYVAVGEFEPRWANCRFSRRAAGRASCEYPREMGLICPAAQGSEAAWAGEVEVIAAPNLLAMLVHFKGTLLLPPPEPKVAAPLAAGLDLERSRDRKSRNARWRSPPRAGTTFADERAARRGQVDAGGCLPGILPPLEPGEALEVSMVASVAGELDGGGLRRRRPFRAPHHSASMPALVGGGLKVRPGEISLAHLGVLFLDELPEFQRAVLESLRQPLETGRVSVARANTHVTFPARVQLVAAMNPCRCGHLGDPALACARAPRCAADYQAQGLGAAARPHRPACRGAGRRRRRPGPAAAGRRQRRSGGAGRRRARESRPRASTATGSAPTPRPTASCSKGRDARRAGPQAAGGCRGGDAAVGARLSPRAAGRADDRRPWRERRGRADPRRRGAELSAAGAAQLIASIN